MFRPRDLILLFSGIDKLNLTLPIDKQEIDDVLLPNFASRLVIEWGNELLFVLPKEDKDVVLREIGSFANRKSPFVAGDFVSFFRGKTKQEPMFILEQLFKYSIVGHIDEKERVFFTHRQDPARPIPFDPEGAFTFHKAIRVYGNSRLSGR